MPADLVKRVNLDLIYNPFLQRVLEALAQCRARGADYVAVLGTRSYGEQHALRGAYLAGKGGRAAPAGQSQHQFGLAIDFCRDSDLTKKGLQPSWKAADYRVLGEECTKQGLHWGNTYNDSPHIGIAGWVSAKDLAPLDRLYRQTDGDQLTKLRAVWDYIESNPSPRST